MENLKFVLYHFFKNIVEHSYNLIKAIYPNMYDLENKIKTIFVGKQDLKTFDLLMNFEEFIVWCHERNDSNLIVGESKK